VRVYLNDASLQGQFSEASAFEDRLRDLLRARLRVPALERDLWVSRSIGNARVSSVSSFRETLQRCRDRDLQRAVLLWLDRRGPFVEDDRLGEADDYFEFRGRSVTDTGLGEAARRIKAGEVCGTFSFTDGIVDYAHDPLAVDHGLEEDRLGRYDVPNSWTIDDLVERLVAAGPAVKNWPTLVEMARLRFARLEIADLHLNPVLAREPFEASIAKSALALMSILDDYAGSRTKEGVDTGRIREMIETYFSGDRAPFSGESSTNERSFRHEMTFSAPDGLEVFAPWHGKIGHRVFRMHFEWPLAGSRDRLSVVYLGPKITKG